LIEEEDLENKMIGADAPVSTKKVKEKPSETTNELVLIRMKPERSVQLPDGRHAGPEKEIEVSRSIADWLVGIGYAEIISP
jgi:hypothetical protein